MHLATHGILARPTATASFSNTKSVDFDGVDDFVDCGQITSLANASLFTISGWFNQTTLDQERFMFGTYTSVTNLIACYTWSDGKMYIDLRNGAISYGQFDYSSVVTAGQWFHLAIVYNGSGVDNASKLKLYINGSLQTLSYNLTIPTNTNATQGDFRIGCLENYTQEFLGNIDELAIFNSELSASNVTNIYNSGTPTDLTSLSPISWWRMGDGDTYPTLTDNGSGSNDGTMTNMVSGDIVTDVP